MYPISAARWYVRLILFFFPAKRISQVYPNGDRRVLHVKTLFGRIFLVKTIVTLTKPPKYPMSPDEVNFLATLKGRYEKRLFLKAMKKKYEGKAVTQ